MLLKKTLLIAAICTMPAAYALTTHNNTDDDSTVLIHSPITGKDVCSNKLPKGAGITKAHSTSTVNDMVTVPVCGFSDCPFEVKTSNNCSGESIATAIYNYSSGVSNVTMLNPNYKITQQGPYELTLDGHKLSSTL